MWLGGSGTDSVVECLYGGERGREGGREGERDSLKSRLCAYAAPGCHQPPVGRNGTSRLPTQIMVMGLPEKRIAKSHRSIATPNNRELCYVCKENERCPDSGIPQNSSGSSLLYDHICFWEETRYMIHLHSYHNYYT